MTLGDYIAHLQGLLPEAGPGAKVLNCDGTEPREPFIIINKWPLTASREEEIPVVLLA